MTYGWILESASDAFLEGTANLPDLEPAPEPTYSCPFCDRVFDDRHLWQGHVSGQHRVGRPVILLRGREPAKRHVIRTALSREDILTVNATSARVAIDGEYLPAMSLRKVSDRIAALRQAEMRLILVNDSQNNAEPVESSYAISVRIATTQELRNVENAFAKFMIPPAVSKDSSGRSISRALIDQFLADPRSTGAGADYAAGLAEYLMGVLVKERPATERLTTPVARYRELYGEALVHLADFNRPLARLIVSIIRFALNDFSRAATQTGFWDLDSANDLLKNPEQATSSFFDENAALRRVCPIDHATSGILNLAKRMSSQTRWSRILDNECKKMANSEIFDAADQQKILAIWAAAAWRRNAKRSAIEPLRQIAATYPFDEWAKPYLERINKMTRTSNKTVQEGSTRSKADAISTKDSKIAKGTKDSKSAKGTKNTKSAKDSKSTKASKDSKDETAKSSAKNMEITPTISGYFQEPKATVSAFYKVLKQHEVKHFTQDDVARAAALMEETDSGGERLWALMSQKEDMPTPVDRWIWRATQRRLKSVVGDVFEPQAIAPDPMLNALCEALAPAVRSKDKQESKNAQNWLRLGICWLIKKCSLQPWKAAERLLPILFVNQDDAARVSKRALQRGKANELRLATAMAGLGQEMVETAQAERDSEKRIATDLRHKVAEASSVNDRLKTKIKATQRALDQKSNSLKETQADLAAKSERWGYDLNDRKTKQRVLLKDKVAPLLSDAIDALEIEPPAPGVALSRLKAVLSIIDGATS